MKEEEIKQKRHEYYLKNKERILEQNRKWRSKNKDKFNQSLYKFRRKKAQKLKEQGIMFAWKSNVERERCIERFNRRIKKREIKDNDKQ